MKKRQEKRVERGLKEKEAKSRKKAQMMQMPFGVIFSILLIVIFIVVAFFAIKHFLGVKNCVQINTFVEDLQNEVDKVWRLTSTSGNSFPASLPSGIKYVCFADLNKATNGEYKQLANEFKGNLQQNNLFFYPPGKSCGNPSANIEHINLPELIKDKNPYCFENKEKVSISLEKVYGEGLVRIK